MEDLRLLTYCGLYCDLCASRCRIPAQAQQLRDSLKKEGCEYWGDSIPGFREFWPVLERLADPAQSCPGCRQGGGYPQCDIRTCARQRGIDMCPACPDFPCKHIEALGRIYPTLIADGLRLKRVGSAAWLQEQRQRVATGFAYADIRCPHGEPPTT